MEILVAILIIAVLAGVAFVVLQRRTGGSRGPREPRSTATVRATRDVPRSEPLTAAVVDHAQVTDPRDVPAAEQRLQAEARQVAAVMHADAHRVESERAAAGVAQETARVDGHVVDDRYAGTAPTEPEYADPDQAVRDYRDPAAADRR